MRLICVFPSGTPPLVSGTVFPTTCGEVLLPNLPSFFFFLLPSLLFFFFCCAPVLTHTRATVTPTCTYAHFPPSFIQPLLHHSSHLTLPSLASAAVFPPSPPPGLPGPSLVSMVTAGEALSPSRELLPGSFSESGSVGGALFSPPL